jgi:streptogramin lyase
LWFTEPGVNKIGKIATDGTADDFLIPTSSSNPQGITFGPDGNIWFIEAAANQIGVITPSGTFLTAISVPAASGPQGITVGPDGNIWFTEAAAGKIGKVVPATGVVTEYPVSSTVVLPQGITTGPDGNLWFTEPSANKIGAMTPSGNVIAEYALPASGRSPQTITTGSDGNLWFTEAGASMVGRISPTDGKIQEFPVPTPGGVTQGITSGSDANLWVTEPGAAQVSRITTSGIVTEFAVSSGSQPWGITTGPDGNIWLTEAGASKVARVELSQLIHATGMLVTSQVGTSPSLTIASFTADAVNAVPADFTATIDWGDGTTAPAGTITISASAPGKFLVSATKTYSSAGSYLATVTIHDRAGSTSTASSTINVANATGNNIAPVEGKLFSGQVAAFSDPQTTGQVGQYSATIDWGDNSTNSTGAITYAGGTAFTVAGSHTYSEEGPFPVTVTVNGPNGRFFLSNSQAIVADAPIHAVATTLMATTSTPFSGIVATFSDENPFATTADFRATIIWGDGHTSTGTILAPISPNTFFSVSGTNTYATSGTFKPQVTIQDVGGSTDTAISTIAVAFPATGNVINPVEGLAFSGLVASFSDPQTTGQVGQYSAMIDWGDGSTNNPPGTVTYTGGAAFTVSGSHTYAEEGPYGVTVNVTGPNGRTFVAFGQAVVADAPLHALGSYIAPTAGVSFIGVVATFSDDNPNGAAADFLAQVNWGDGHISSGVVAGPDGAGFFTVTASNTYISAIPYTSTVTIFDKGGSSVTTSPMTIFVLNGSAQLSGRVDVASISGPNKNFNITSVNRPTFDGTTLPLSIVQLFAQRASSNPSLYVYLGQTISDANGAWSLTAPRLPDGTYTVTASIINSTGSPPSSIGFPTAPVAIVTPANPLVIDTVAPRVSGIRFNRKAGIITVVIQDAESGLDAASVQNPSNYTIMLRRTLTGQNSGGTILTPAIAGFYSTALSTTLLFSAPLTPGHYLFMVKSGGVIDMAANALDGEFGGRLPSGDGRPGGNFIAQLNVANHAAAKPHRLKPFRFRISRHR